MIAGKGENKLKIEKQSGKNKRGRGGGDDQQRGEKRGDKLIQGAKPLKIELKKN